MDTLGADPIAVLTFHARLWLVGFQLLKTLQVAVAKTQVAAAEIQPAKASHGKLVQQ